MCRQSDNAALVLSVFSCGRIMGVSHTSETVRSPTIQPGVHIHTRRLLTYCRHRPFCPTVAVSRGGVTLAWLSLPGHKAFTC